MMISEEAAYKCKINVGKTSGRDVAALREEEASK